MATTTLGIIRATLVARLEALTVASGRLTTDIAGRGRSALTQHSPAVWSFFVVQAPHASDDRTFLLRWQGGMRDVGPTSQAERRTQIDAALDILYYVPADEHADDVDMRIQQDALDIDKDLTDWLETGPLAGMLPTTAVTSDSPPMEHPSGAALVKRIALLIDFWRAG